MWEGASKEDRMAERGDDRARVLRLQGEWFEARAEHGRIVEQVRLDWCKGRPGAR